MLSHPFSGKILSDVQFEPPLAQLVAISSGPLTGCLGEEVDLHLSATSFQIILESGKVTPQPPFSQTKHLQLLQPHLKRLTTRVPLNISAVIFLLDKVQWHLHFKWFKPGLIFQALISNVPLSLFLLRSWNWCSGKIKQKYMLIYVLSSLSSQHWGFLFSTFFFSALFPSALKHFLVICHSGIKMSSFSKLN